MPRVVKCPNCKQAMPVVKPSQQVVDEKMWAKSVRAEITTIKHAIKKYNTLHPTLKILFTFIDLDAEERIVLTSFDLKLSYMLMEMDGEFTKLNELKEALKALGVVL